MVDKLLKALEEAKTSCEKLKEVYEEAAVDNHRNDRYTKAGFYVDRILVMDDVLEDIDRTINNIKRGSPN